MNLATLNPVIDFTFHVLRAFSFLPPLEQEPVEDIDAEVNRLIGELFAARTAHRPTRGILAQLKEARCKQLQKELYHG
jgi:hypothetical protein